MRGGAIAWAWVIVAALAGAPGCSREGAGPAPGRSAPPASVTVARAERGVVPVTVRSVGNVEAVAEVMLRPQVAGQVVGTPVAEGTDVEAGTELVVLDERPFEAALHAAEAIAARDRALAADMRRQANQFAAARASNAANEQEAAAAVARAEAAEAQVLADEAAARTAALDLEYCRIKAPFAGRLGPLLVKPGAIVKANEADLVSLVQLRPIDAGFAVAERHIEAIREGQGRAPLRVTATVAGGERGAIVGALSFIDNRVDMATGTIRLKARFANEDLRLWPGRFVEVTLTLADEEGVVVPSAAVQASQRGQAVWVVKADQTAELRPVKVRREFEGRSVIDSGVEEGETVVTDGQLRLAPGAKVEVRTAARPTLLPEGAGQEGAL